MATNFKINISRNGDTLYLNLRGDFDGSSAWELLNDMNDKGNNMRRIFIDTNGLKHVHPFGQAIFEKQLPAVKRYKRTIILVGKHAKSIDPDYLSKPGW
jgi:anti-anti-sigma regulatory factor